MSPDHAALALYEDTARFHRETLRGLTAARSDLQGDQAKLWNDSVSKIALPSIDHGIVMIGDCNPCSRIVGFNTSCRDIARYGFSTIGVRGPS